MRIVEKTGWKHINKISISGNAHPKRIEVNYLENVENEQHHEDGDVCAQQPNFAVAL